MHPARKVTLFMERDLNMMGSEKDVAQMHSPWQALVSLDEPEPPHPATREGGEHHVTSIPKLSCTVLALLRACCFLAPVVQHEISGETNSLTSLPGT